jgi:Na+/proline symporter
MFTKDVFVHYGGKEKFGEKRSVHFARGFIVVVTVIAYCVALALKEKQGIFEIAIRYAFSGFAAMAPVMVAALFWKRSTKWGALAATLFVALSLAGNAALQGPPQKLPPPPAVAKPTTNTLVAAAAPTNTASNIAATNAPAAKPSSAAAPVKPKEDIIWQVGEGTDAVKILSRAPNGDVRFMKDYMTVVPMVFGSALFMVFFSLVTKPPSDETIAKYFEP